MVGIENPAAFKYCCRQLTSLPCDPTPKSRVKLQAEIEVDDPTTGAEFVCWFSWVCNCCISAIKALICACKAEVEVLAKTGADNKTAPKRTVISATDSFLKIFMINPL